MAGGFVWTGFDYKGEPTPYNWPNINCHFGNIDIAGFPKDSFYYYKSIWNTDEITVHVFPHWNWNKGERVNVWVYSNAYQVQLLLNGQDLGRKVIPSSTTKMGRVWKSHVEWDVTFAPGNITAIGYDSKGTQIGVDSRVSTMEPSAVKLSVEFPTNSVLRADGVDVALVTCEILDAQGNLVPTAGNSVQFSVTGPGTIIGLGNGNPNSHEPDYPQDKQHGQRSAFGGRSRVVLQSTSGSGTIKVVALSAGLKSDTISIVVR